MFRETQDLQMTLNDRYFTAGKQAKTAGDTLCFVKRRISR